MTFTLSDVVRAAGVGDPWERATEVAEGDPAAITAMATGFTGAADHARTAMAATGRADPATASAYRVDGVPMHDAERATGATRTALGDGGEQSAEIGRMLASVATELSTAQQGVTAAITTLDAQLARIATASAELSAASTRLQPRDAAVLEQALFDQVIEAVRTHGGTVARIVEGYGASSPRGPACSPDSGSPLPTRPPTPPHPPHRHR